jgi:hypothetical protein
MLKTINKNVHVAAIFFDLTKVLPLNCEILLSELHSYNIQGIAVNWFRSSLQTENQK